MSTLTVFGSPSDGGLDLDEFTIEEPSPGELHISHEDGPRFVLYSDGTIWSATDLAFNGAYAGFTRTGGRPAVELGVTGAVAEFLVLDTDGDFAVDGNKIVTDGRRHVGFLDTFATDREADYAVTGGDWTVAGGVLSPAGANDDMLVVYQDFAMADGIVQVKVNPGATLGTLAVRLIARHFGSGFADDIEMDAANATGLRIQTREGGSAANKATTAGTVFTANTPVWLRLRVHGSAIIGERWTAAPTPTGTPAASVAYELASSEWKSLGKAGRVGARIVMGGNLGHSLDDLRAISVAPTFDPQHV